MYAVSWKDIGVYLDMEIEQLLIIQADHPNNAVKSCNVLWEKWLTKKIDATWEQLFNATDHIQLPTLLSSVSLQGKRHVFTCAH